MKTAALIPPTLLIAALSVSGCDGLDNPSEIVGQPKDFNGAYSFSADTPPLDLCNLVGSLRLDDGDVEGEATYLNREGKKVIFTGSVHSDGYIDGKLSDPTEKDGSSADFNGLYTFTATPDKDRTCDSIIGEMRLEDGDITGNPEDQNGKSIKLTGTIIYNGSIVNGLFDGGKSGFFSGTIDTSGEGSGAWSDSSGPLRCGEWVAKKKKPRGTFSGVVSAFGGSSGTNWNDEYFGCVGTWSAENQTIRPE